MPNYKKKWIESQNYKKSGGKMATKHKVTVRNYYQLLGLETDFTLSQIQEKLSEEHRKLNTLKDAPNKKRRAEANDKLKIVYEAKDIFSDEHKRNQYDALLRAETAISTVADPQMRGLKYFNIDDYRNPDGSYRPVLNNKKMDTLEDVARGFFGFFPNFRLDALEEVKSEKAYEVYKQAIDEGFHCRPIYVHFCSTCHKIKRYAELISYCSVGLQLYPECESLHRYFILRYFRDHFDIDAAKFYLERAEEEIPKYGGKGDILYHLKYEYYLICEDFAGMVDCEYRLNQVEPYSCNVGDYVIFRDAREYHAKDPQKRAYVEEQLIRARKVQERKLQEEQRELAALLQANTVLSDEMKKKVIANPPFPPNFYRRPDGFFNPMLGGHADYNDKAVQRVRGNANKYKTPEEEQLLYEIDRELVYLGYYSCNQLWGFCNASNEYGEYSDEHIYYSWLVTQLFPYNKSMLRSAHKRLIGAYMYGQNDLDTAKSYIDLAKEQCATYNHETEYLQELEYVYYLLCGDVAQMNECVRLACLGMKTGDAQRRAQDFERLKRKHNFQE